MTITVDRRLPLERTALGEQITPYPGRERRQDARPQETTPSPALPTQRELIKVVEPARRWLGEYRRLLRALDIGVLTLVGIATALMMVASAPSDNPASKLALTLVFVASWSLTLTWGRCYEVRFLGHGTDEFRRVATSALRVSAAAAALCFALDADFMRRPLLVALPLGSLGLLSGRFFGRMALKRRRRQGRCGHRVVILGTISHVQDLALELSRDTGAGLRVVAACTPGAHVPWIQIAPDFHLPVLGSLSTVAQALKLARADTLAVTASPGISAEALRRLSYELEGSGIDLIVAPGLMNVTGTRLSIRPIAGLPLLHVDEPELDGTRVIVKSIFDRCVATCLLLVLAPIMVALAVAVRVTSPGPALFRQIRVGRDGRPFTVYKFRSMSLDAERQREFLKSLNVYDGVLFKIREDPRVTRVGRVLRRYSLDELPQLFNVLKGDMSLVGPRPPLPAEVAEYVGHTRRRLLVKPGMTGLWQVSGRNNLSWEDTVRLDLQYVENWSLGLDISVLAKTAVAVVRGTGAY